MFIFCIESEVININMSGATGSNTWPGAFSIIFGHIDLALVVKNQYDYFTIHFLKLLLTHISRQCHISIPPENVRKPIVFWRFQGV